jgi:hypothetical protein
MVTRGYSSLTFAYSAARTIRRGGKPCHLYYFGDHDPSGVDIDRVLATYLDEFGATECVVNDWGELRPLTTFERVGVQPWQTDPSDQGER